ncbi:dihydropteroate synthase [Palleronia sediminis]|uniref:Dihydropteroate synthase n=1 Tax=Palleronia sediminis TaxID=2547833 RepID=A0A4R6AA49_9RHOB|nr:dihydropteroate synthase [Palleronia sediminis]TDL79795.1 dihydropteroate synthase [Palleronia sediminis]
MTYARPLVQSGGLRPEGALSLAGGACWFTHAAILSRGAPPRIVAAGTLDAATRDALCAPRAPLAGLAMDRPRVMGIVNVTPDSFSDGGLFEAPEAAAAHARALIAAGSDILDLGGESTRPGAAPVAPEAEAARVVPALSAIRATSAGPISVDTRRANVARAAAAAGVDMLNDVSALRHDPEMAAMAAALGLPICLMHSGGEPATMQDAPAYGDVVLDVYDHLAERVAAAEAAGIPRARIAVDPGIGFGKTLAHNLALLQHLSLFHALGCAVLLGTSRKRFIGTLGGTDTPAARMPGSVATALYGAAQGVQFLRVHDVAETVQALTLWRASITGDAE